MSQDDKGRPTLGEKFSINNVEVIESQSQIEIWLRYALMFLIIVTCGGVLVFVAWFDFHDGDDKLCDFLPFATFVLGSFFTAIVGDIFRRGTGKG